MKNRVVPFRVTKCIPKGSRTLFGVTADVRCPCLVRFELKAPAGHSFQAKSIDFLVVTGQHAATLRTNTRATVHFIQRYSVLNAKPNRQSQSLNSFMYYEGPSFEISENANFALAIRTTSRNEDCATTVSFVFEPIPVQCPVRLKPNVRRIRTPIPYLPSILSTTSFRVHSSFVITMPKMSHPLFRTIQNRIVGGSPAHDAHQSMMVAFVRLGVFFCSGSLVAPTWVLTAAHCRIKVSDIAFVGGRTAFSGARIAIKEVLPHERFDFSKSDAPHDLALIELSAAAPSTAVPVRLNRSPATPKEMAYVRASGYGRISENWVGTAPPTLRKVDLPVVPMLECKRDYRDRSADLAIRLNRTLQLCAGYEDGSCDACQGDSGGPLVLFDSKGRLVQVGIVSFGIGCARASIPGVYTRVSHFADWIKSKGVKARFSTDGQNVIAKSLFANVDYSAPPSGDGTDGINNKGSLGSDTEAPRGVKLSTPAIVSASVTAALFVVCTLVIILAYRRYVRRRRPTDSENATGGRTQDVETATELEGCTDTEECTGYTHESTTASFMASQPLSQSTPVAAALPVPPPPLGSASLDIVAEGMRPAATTLAGSRTDGVQGGSFLYKLDVSEVAHEPDSSEEGHLDAMRRR